MGNTRFNRRLPDHGRRGLLRSNLVSTGHLRSGFHGWCRFLWLLIPLCLQFLCMLMIAPKTLPLALVGFWVGSHFSRLKRIPFLALLLQRVFHILANMLSLVFIGIRLEQEFGFVRIGMLYIVSGFGGSLMSALFIQSGISVGASGALFGLLGGMLSELLTNWTIYANKLAALLTLLFIIVINLAVGVLPHVDNFAHIGGFISGFLLGFVFLVRPQFGWVSQRNAPRGNSSTSKSKYKPYQYVLWVVSLVLLIAGFAVGLVFLFRGENMNDRCSWCHYLSCIPTSKWSCNSQKFSCETSQLGNQLNMTCLSNGRSGSYSLTNSSSTEAEKICSQLCS
ncbi:RHOMBOID-like protein 1 isoform X3 [Cucumis sativus]|uniref:RHOMBOID-like protein 1 isoform X3 n=1 Tax=Cucumis sativus TaxID=3659 RepID=UPI0012F4793E|nr:RHOMBOID-like protein 1 isoform X3 [Cucumis sativus]